MPLDWLTEELIAGLRGETTVEDRIIMPLFAELGYSDEDRERGVPVEFMYGSRRGRRPEADFVYFDGVDRSADNSLVTVEAKAVGENLEDAASQADFYSWLLKTSLYVACNGIELVCMQVQVSRTNVQVFRYAVGELAAHWPEVESVLSKAAVLQYATALELRPIRALHIDFTLYLETELADSAARIWRNIARRAVLRPAVAGSVQGWADGPGHEAERLTLNEALDDQFRAVILGDAGCGKTHSLHCGFVGLARARLLDDDAPLPILVDLNDAAGEVEPIAALCVRTLVRHSQQTTAAIMSDLLRLGKAVVLVDGLDECPEAVRVRAVRELVALARAYPNTKWAVACRTVRYQNELSQAAARYSLAPLEYDEQFAFATTVLEPIRVHYLLESIGPGIAQLAEVPLFLGLMVDTYISDGGLPRSRAELMSRFTELMLDRWPAARAMGRGPLVDPVHKAAFLDRVALELWERGERRVRRARLEEVAVAAAPRSDPGALLASVVEDGALDQTGDEYGFCHEVFLDYFTSRALSRGLAQGAPDAAEVCSRSSVDTLVFITGLLTEAGARDAFLDTLLRTDLGAFVEAVQVGPIPDEYLLNMVEDELSHYYLSRYLDVYNAITDVYLTPVKAAMSPWREARDRPHTWGYARRSCRLGVSGLVDKTNRYLHLNTRILRPDSTNYVVVTGGRVAEDDPEVLRRRGAQLRRDDGTIRSPYEEALGAINRQLLDSDGVLGEHRLVEGGTVAAESIRCMLATARSESSGPWEIRYEQAPIDRQLLVELRDLPLGASNADIELALTNTIARWGEAEFTPFAWMRRGRALVLGDMLEMVRALSASGLEVYALAPPEPDLEADAMRHALPAANVIYYYSDARLGELVRWYLESVMTGYRDTVASSFPELAASLSLYSQFPVKCLCKLRRNREPEAWYDVGGGEYSFCAVRPDDPHSWRAEVHLNEEGEPRLEEDWDERFAALADLGRSRRGQSVWIQSIGADTAWPGFPNRPGAPLADQVYKLIRSDLAKLLGER
jgi:hypothetical protein